MNTGCAMSVRAGGHDTITPSEVVVMHYAGRRTLLDFSATRKDTQSDVLGSQRWWWMVEGEKKRVFEDRQLLC